MKAFPRHEASGLVDLNCYLPYLPDPPDRVPIDPPKITNGPWVRQHLYPERAKWRHAPNPNLAVFMNHWSNQLIMRRKKESKVHRDHEQHFRWPPTIIIDIAVEELAHLDELGAASLGLELALHPECRVELMPSTGPPRYAQQLKPAQRADFFEAKRDEAFNNLANALVTDQVLITSAIKRMSLLMGSFHDTRLQQAAKERLAEEPRYFPLHTPNLENLYSLSNQMLRELCATDPIPLDKPKYDWSQAQAA